MEQYLHLLESEPGFADTLPPGTEIVEAQPYGSGQMQTARLAARLPDATTKYYFAKVHEIP